MNKQPDFGNDLAALNDNVTAEVGDVLQALQQKRAAMRPVIVQKNDEPAPGAPTRADAGEVAPDQPIAGVTPARSKRQVNHSRPAHAIEQGEVWKSVTTRLRLETLALLKEACLRQELKKKAPHTGQGIIDEALGDWFRKHGYLRRRDDEAVE